MQDSSSGWADDRLELFIDADNGKTPGRDSGNDYQYNFSFIPEVVAPIEWYEKDTGRSMVGVESAVLLTDGGYRIEILLPWSTLLGASPAALDRIGLALSIVDDDDGGGSDSAVSWHLGSLQPEGGGDPHDTTIWGTAVLGGK